MAYGLWVPWSPLPLQGHKDTHASFYELYSLIFHIEAFNPSRVYLGIWCMVGILLYFPPYSELVFSTPATKQVTFSPLLWYIKFPYLYIGLVLRVLFCPTGLSIYKNVLYGCGAGPTQDPDAFLCTNCLGWYHFRPQATDSLWTLLSMMSWPIWLHLGNLELES